MERPGGAEGERSDGGMERGRDGETARPRGGEECAAREVAILSASPELFLELRDREVVTRPIKGTRSRSTDPVVDEALRMELLQSAKDRAELAMIVDLERNDLGRVCEFGSVRVVPRQTSSGSHRRDAGATPHRRDAGATPKLFELETHPTVHHLVATVRGRLRAGLDAVDLLRATFPGGSITGAPKVRAMEIIDELEPTARSVYTGAIGYLGLDGSAVFNIAIRTMIRVDGRIHIHAGGGIVADSVPEDEYDETEAKALGLCRAVGDSGAQAMAACEN
jgi:para-aminobenzoate synthetase component I